jgi:adenylate cyclase
MSEEAHTAADVVRWMLKEGRHHTHMREFGDEMCRRIVAAGIPLWRGFCAVGTLHPQVAATAYVWRRSEAGATRQIASHERVQTPELAQSPFAEVKRTHRVLRRRLADPDCPQDYPVVPPLREQGATDYVAMPMVCSSGAINVISWVTDRAGGFTDAEIAALGEVTEALAIIVELQSMRRVARSLLDTYVGRRTGERVLSGAITRGSGEAIRAVIWICDLRGFTRLTDSAPRHEVIALLNDYFEIVAEAVAAEGGEVLKFIGDAMLAIFEIDRKRTPAEACGGAAQGSARNGRGDRRAQSRAGGPRRATDQVRSGPASGRCHLRQHRRPGPARLHSNRSRRQSCGAAREARLGTGEKPGYVRQLRRRGA